MISSGDFGRKTVRANIFSLVVHLREPLLEMHHFTASENVFPLTVLELGPPISFHRRFFIEIVCKNYTPLPV